MTTFNIYPAIDLMEGNVVRLKKGDPNQKTIFSNNPLSIANKWLSFGAKWLHIVNLDAAFGYDDDNNMQAITMIQNEFQNKSIAIQIGGGIRSFEQIDNYLNRGITRIILGTKAIEDQNFVADAIRKFGPSRIVIGIDARNGFVSTHGWKKDSSIIALSLTQELKTIGVKTIIYTDINRDGIGSGINLSATQELAQQSGMEVIASGGVNSISDIVSVREAGLSGVIVGRALYDGTIDPKKLFEIQE
jgi:phosphoribosylformimino-5-aminoimidazole carboxamide ribotide isomerase